MHLGALRHTIVAVLSGGRAIRGAQRLHAASYANHISAFCVNTYLQSYFNRQQQKWRGKKLVEKGDSNSEWQQVTHLCTRVFHKNGRHEIMNGHFNTFNAIAAAGHSLPIHQRGRILSRALPCPALRWTKKRRDADDSEIDGKNDESTRIWKNSFWCSMQMLKAPMLACWTTGAPKYKCLEIYYVSQEARASIVSKYL